MGKKKVKNLFCLIDTELHFFKRVQNALIALSAVKEVMAFPCMMVLVRHTEILMSGYFSLGWQIRLQYVHVCL